MDPKPAEKLGTETVVRLPPNHTAKAVMRKKNPTRRATGTESIGSPRKLIAIATSTRPAMKKTPTLRAFRHPPMNIDSTRMKRKNAASGVAKSCDAPSVKKIDPSPTKTSINRAGRARWNSTHQFRFAVQTITEAHSKYAARSAYPISAYLTGCKGSAQIATM